MKKERMIRYCDLGIEWSLYILIFILPFRHTASVRAFGILFPSFLWILKMFLERRILFLRTPLDYPILAFFLWGLISLLTATDLGYSLRQIRAEMATYFLLFYLVINNLKDEEKLKGLIKALALGVFTLSFYSIMEFLQRENPSIMEIIKVNTMTVDLGAYLVLTIPVIFVLYKLSDDIKQRAFIFITVLLSMAALYLAHNRAAWIAVIFQVIFFTAIKKRWKTLLATVILITIIVTVSPIRSVLIHEITVRSSTGEIAKRETSVSRLVIWEEGIEKIGEYPITGIGYGKGSFQKAFPDSPALKGDTGLWHTHNIFLETALEIGVPGLIIFIWLLYSLARSLIRGMMSKNTFAKLLATSIFISLAGFIIRNQFDYIYIDDTALMFWLLMGMGIAVALKGRHGYG